MFLFGVCAFGKAEHMRSSKVKGAQQWAADFRILRCGLALDAGLNTALRSDTFCHGIDELDRRGIEKLQALSTLKVFVSILRKFMELCLAAVRN